MSAKVTISTRKTARAAENRTYVRSLLKVRHPQFAAALESAVEDIMRDQDQPTRSCSKPPAHSRPA